MAKREAKVLVAVMEAIVNHTLDAQNEAVPQQNMPPERCTTRDSNLDQKKRHFKERVNQMDYASVPNLKTRLAM